MYIEWEKEKLKKEILKYARSNRIVARRMKSVQAAKNFCDLEPPSNGRAHFLTGGYEGCFALDLERQGNGKRIICKPIGESLEQFPDGHYKKETVTGLRIIEINDYH